MYRTELRLEFASDYTRYSCHDVNHTTVPLYSFPGTTSDKLNFPSVSEALGAAPSDAGFSVALQMRLDTGACLTLRKLMFLNDHMSVLSGDVSNKSARSCSHIHPMVKNVELRRRQRAGFQIIVAAPAV